MKMKKLATILTAIVIICVSMFSAPVSAGMKGVRGEVAIVTLSTEPFCFELVNDGMVFLRTKFEPFLKKNNGNSSAAKRVAEVYFRSFCVKIAEGAKKTPPAIEITGNFDGFVVQGSTAKIYVMGGIKYIAVDLTNVKVNEEDLLPLAEKFFLTGIPKGLDVRPDPSLPVPPTSR